MQSKPLLLNSIHCNPCRPWQFTVAGGDAYVRVYDRRKAEAASWSAEGEEQDAAASTRNFAAALATPVRPLGPSPPAFCCKTPGASLLKVGAVNWLQPDAARSCHPGGHTQLGLNIVFHPHFLKATTIRQHNAKLDFHCRNL